MTFKTLPKFPYGAVYFRKSNPPREDWERDYQTASEDGHTIFRHWFLWSAVEVAPGKFDWSDYDRQLDLAAENGIKTIVAEMTTAAPEWAYRKYADSRLETRDGRKVHSHMSGSCVTGGFPGLCLDSDEFRAAAETWIRELANRYKDHPGLGGYDIWNENNMGDELCYCPHTAARFREWLKNKYPSLKDLGAAWHRHSFAEWEDVTPPRSMGPYPDTLDWLQFRIDNAYHWMQWRKDIIKSIDPDHPATAHGIAASITGMAPRVADDWRSAEIAEIYGYTWGSSRHGDEPWKQMHAVDLVRAASRGKHFWHAEAYGAPLWMQSQVIGKPRNEGRIASSEDIRFWDMTSFMCGATGLLYLRWRPLLDGPLFGAFGPYALDGTRTDRSDMASKIGKWVAAPEQESLWKSRPVKGDIGIIFVPESQLFTYAQQGSTKLYSQSMQGAYRGFFDNNIQADWVHINHIDEYGVLYLPLPVMLKQETADKLIAWVKAGGTLICEGTPGYFDGVGHVNPEQPALGLAELFGVEESYVEFTPDILDDLRFTFNGQSVWGGVFLQAYEPTSGKALGLYEGVPGEANGQVAVAENSYGKGRTLLVGTMPGYGHAQHAARSGASDANPHEFGGSSRFFAEVLVWSGVDQAVTSSDKHVMGRLHTGQGGTYLWIANPTHRDRMVSFMVNPGVGAFTEVETLWGAGAELVNGAIELVAPARDVTVLKLS